jgi:DDE_Tnp_1-associated
MNSTTNLTLLQHFSILPDPRKTGHGMVRHELLDVVIIAILAVICGADSWVEIAVANRKANASCSQTSVVTNSD